MQPNEKVQNLSYILGTFYRMTWAYFYNKIVLMILITSILAQVTQSRQQLIEYLTWKDGHNRQFFTIFRNLRILSLKRHLNGNNCTVLPPSVV